MSEDFTYPKSSEPTYDIGGENRGERIPGFKYLEVVGLKGDKVFIPAKIILEDSALFNPERGTLTLTLRAQSVSIGETPDKQPHYGTEESQVRTNPRDMTHTTLDCAGRCCATHRKHVSPHVMCFLTSQG